MRFGNFIWRRGAFRALAGATFALSALTVAPPALAQSVINVPAGATQSTLGDYSSGVFDGGTIASGGTFNNDGFLSNIGDIDNSGTLNNFDTILNSSTIINNATFNNFANISSSGTILNTGTMINDVTINITGGILSTSSSGTFINNSGTLQIGNGGTSGSLSGNVQNDALLIFNRSDASTYSGIISGTGPLAKEGAGTLTFSGANTYTGATSVEAGTLIVSGSIANSATTIALGATLQIGNGGTSGSLTGGITNYGSLVFDRTNASTYSGLISSVGTLTKRGAGTLTLSGLNTYTGSTQVEGGTLIVNGSIAGSAATVASGATLGGSGAMGSVTVNSGGFFAPGNSIGANNMLSLDLKSGAIFAVEINNGGFVAGTNNDHATVSSLATIESGAIIAVSSYPAGQDGSTYTPGRYTILDAGVGLTVLGGVTIDEHFAFLDFTYGFDAFSLWLDSVLATPSLCLAGSSDNECATGKGVSSLGSGNPLYSQLLGMTDAQALAAQNALSGEVHASAQSVFIQSAGLIRNAALARLRESFDQYGGNDTVILGYAEQAAAPYKRHPAMWAQMFGAAGEIDGNDNAADLDSHEYGVLGGVDGFVFDDWRLGLLAGYSRTDFDVDDGRASNGDSDNVHLGVYGGTEFGSLGLRFGLAHTWHKIDTKREALGQTLKADYDARTFQAFTEIGYRFDHQTFWFEPFAGLAYVRHHTEAFSESGGSAALDVEAETSDTGFTTLGARAAVDVMLGQVATTLRGSAGWRHAFGDTVPESVNAFSGGDSFTVSGTPIARNAAVLEAGLDLHASEMAVITLTYAGQFASDAHEHTGHVKAIIAF